MTTRYALLLLAAGALWPLMALATTPDAPPADPPPYSEETQECLDCHEFETPGLVADWKASRHSRTTPSRALALPAVERRISAGAVPEAMREVAVGCYECHTQHAEAHQDNFEHFDYQVNVVVSPNDCRTCHPVEVGEYAGTKKAEALANLTENPVYHTLVETITRTQKAEGGHLVPGQASDGAKNATCYACHGTRVTVEGMQTVVTEAGDEVDVPKLTNWPNQGVGRVNPDGSRGACTSCHPRHSFSLEVARDPHTCGQCHLKPDVPAYNVYEESKHGNIASAQRHGWNMDAVPWRVGADFRAPTCATCHNALLVTPDGDPVVQRTHDFGARLWLRIFGLIYSHPQPLHGGTYTIRNADDLPLPTTFDGRPASGHLLGKEAQQQRRATMKRVCQACHSTSWAEGYLTALEAAAREADTMVAAATGLVSTAWSRGLADPANPFDEQIEQLWVEQWLFYANSVRYASAMAGPDYAAFKNGWWDLTQNLQAMEALLDLNERVNQ